MYSSFKKKIDSGKGFTLVELLVSVSIFVFMTALLLSKYGSFNQGILLTNLAYDVALTIRTAQSYGLNVKSKSRTADEFEGSFGVHFDKTASGSPAKNTQIILFADVGTVANSYDTEDVIMSTYNIKRGSVVSELTVLATSKSTLDLVFKRPDPKAMIHNDVNNDVATIELKTSDGSTKKIYVRNTGQIGVVN